MSKTEKNIRRVALSCLARRDYSEPELARKLRAQGFGETEIVPTLKTLKEEGYLNDLRFVENYIQQRKNKGFGPLRIQAELRTHAIPEEMIADLLEITDNAWFGVAKQTLHKQFKGQRPQDEKTLAKQLRFLQTRGFTEDQIKSLFSDYELC